MKLRSFIYVAVQFVSIFLLLSIYDFKGIVPWYFIFSLFGIVLALWAIWVMRKSTFTVMPDPGNYFRLITNGPYRLIRHPMYASLFLFITPIVIDNSNFESLAIFCLFSVNMILKLLYEENVITVRFPDYETYKKKTWRLIPMVF